MANVSSGKYLYSNVSDVLPFDLKVQNSQYVKVPADRAVDVAVDAELQYRLPVVTNAVYMLGDSYWRGRLAVQIASNRGEPTPTTGLVANIICMLEQSLLSGLYKHELEIGNTSSNSFKCPKGLQPLIQSWYYLFTNRHGDPTCEADLKVTQYIDIIIPEDIATVDGTPPTQTVTIRATDTPVAPAVTTLKYIRGPRCPFAELALNCSQSVNMINLSLSNGLAGQFATVLDSGLLYRVKMLRAGNVIVPIASGDPPLVFDPNPWIPTVEFVGRSCCDMANRPYGIQGNIPINFKLTRQTDAYVVKCSFVSENNNLAITGPASVSVTSLDLFVKQVTLNNDALAVIQADREKVYSFHGWNMSSFVLPTATEYTFQQTLDYCPKTPSLVIGAFVRNAALRSQPPPTDSSEAFESFMSWGYSDVPNTFNNNKFVIRGLKVTVGGRVYPESDSMRGSLASGAANLQTYLGESDIYEMFKRSLVDPSSITMPCWAGNLGCFAIQLINTDVGAWHNTQQLATDDKPYVEVDYSFVPSASSPLAPNDYSLAFCLVTDRTMLISNNQTVSFSSS